MKTRIPRTPSIPGSDSDYAETREEYARQMQSPVPRAHTDDRIRGLRGVEQRIFFR
ncbi:hypothetical protein ACXR0O_24860 [Verrucomicrobiota bacterium sgz303538]